MKKGFYIALIFLYGCGTINNINSIRTDIHDLRNEIKDMKEEEKIAKSLKEAVTYTAVQFTEDTVEFCGKFAKSEKELKKAIVSGAYNLTK